MANMNHSLGQVETIILPATPGVSFISSTLVRSVARAGGDVTAYVPINVATAIQEGAINE
jgi:pantetheine-phosphate adenylyltransferase